VLQFVLEAVRAEAFNPATLFLFGCYTIGKERLFLEAARILQRKVRGEVTVYQ
jgi:DNA cross-link repair 1A protein